MRGERQWKISNCKQQLLNVNKILMIKYNSITPKKRAKKTRNFIMKI